MNMSSFNYWFCVCVCHVVPHMLRFVRKSADIPTSLLFVQADLDKQRPKNFYLKENKYRRLKTDTGASKGQRRLITHRQ